jgi:copper chaperone
MNIAQLVFAGLSVLGLFMSAPAVAAEPTTTLIAIKGMHCAGCAAKVARRLNAVEGVAAAQADAKKAIAVVSPKEDAIPSPRSLWEAVEEAGYEPTKLVGPSGTFTSKPKS